MNEALFNFLEEDITTPKGRKFAIEVLDFMRDKMVKFQEETGNLYNLRSHSGRRHKLQASKNWIKKNIPTLLLPAQKKFHYYTNSSQLPVGFTDDVFEALKLQNELQTKYTGGTVLHIFLGEKISDPMHGKKFG